MARPGDPGGGAVVLYALIRKGDLVDVARLFYLILGNTPAPLSLLGMLAIIGGLAIVQRRR